MHYHIVGIAGAGMSAIANLLLDQGHQVSGSDLQPNQLTAALAARGARIFSGHHPDYVVGADALVYTSAAAADHPEVAAAERAGIRRLKRADLWRAWSQQRPVVAVAGTHGKTTTTALIAFVLTEAGLDPGFLIGGTAYDLPTNARWGDPTAPLVLEADEYDRTFLALTPQLAIITTVEWDHPDIYPDAADYTAAFAQFAAQARGWVLHSDSWQPPTTDWPAARLRYGFTAGCDYYATGSPSNATFQLRDADQPLAIELQLPGRHNLSNALAAAATADVLGVPAAAIQAALQKFRGTARRFELKGSAGGVTVVDDYAHHPTEVQATLAAARERFAGRRIVAYLQPHTFSRTTALADAWPPAFAAAALVLVGDIYAARENGDRQGVARDLAARIATSAAARYAGNLAQASAAALAVLQPGDVLVTLGAGDGYQVGERVLAQLQQQETGPPPATKE